MTAQRSEPPSWSGPRQRVPIAGPLLCLALVAVVSAPLAAAEPGPPAGDGPHTVVDDEGTSVAIDGLPQRIISLSPAITETVFALGAGDRLVGGTESDDYPAEAVALPDVATYSGVIMERLVDLAPDLVLAGGNGLTSADDIARLRELGLPVVVLYAPDVDAVAADIELIGAAIGETTAAGDVVAALDTRMADITAAAGAASSRPRVFYELGADSEIYAPAPGSFLADMIVRAGGEPITTGDPALWSIPLESLLVADPEVIVLGDAAYGTCPDAVAVRPGWASMSAIRTGAVRPVDDVVVTRPGPRLADGLAELAQAIHPELQLDLVADPGLCAAA
jgi:iron complex transport system substrate-binding protein